MGETEGSDMNIVRFSEQLIIGNLKSNISIITLWTQKELISKGLDSESYSTIGQLYSKAGINAVIRNVFANPAVRYIILCGADKSESGKALLSLSRNGIDKSHNIAGIENAHIEKEIPKEDVDVFRKNVEIIDMIGVTDPKKIQEEMNGLEKKEAFGKSKTFPEPKLELPERFPTDESVFRIRAKTVGSAWLTILSKIMNFGHMKKSHHSRSQKELLNVVAVITDEDPDSIKWYDFFNFTRKELEDYYPQVLTPNKIPGINYTYGQRLMDHNGVDQINSVVEKLKKEPHTRRAIAVTWDVGKDAYNPNAPCLDLVNFLVQDNRLFMNAFFRSHDMYRGWPQNAFALRKLQKKVSDDTGIRMGSLTIFSASAHIYEESIKEVKELLEIYYSGKEHEWDPRGNIVIKIDNKKRELVISHYSQEGKKLEEFRGKTAKGIFKILDSNHVISQISHALDIGSELQKAELAMRYGLKYNQDDELEIK